jgi:hypothetical protein
MVYPPIAACAACAAPSCRCFRYAGGALTRADFRCPALRRRPAPKKNGPQAIGRSRGGLTSKIYAVVDALGNPVRWLLTGGEVADITLA